MKIYTLIKHIVFVVLGIMVFIFTDNLVENNGANLPYVVGITMLIFSLEPCVILLVKRKVIEEIYHFSFNLIVIILALILLILIPKSTECFVITCVIWGVWSIIREALESSEKITFKNGFRVVNVLNLIESVVLVVFSVLLIYHPGLEHAKTHVFLLGFELILEVAWVYLDKIEVKIRKLK